MLTLRHRFWFTYNRVIWRHVTCDAKWKARATEEASASSRFYSTTVSTVQNEFRHLYRKKWVLIEFLVVFGNWMGEADVNYVLDVLLNILFDKAEVTLQVINYMQQYLIYDLLLMCFKTSSNLILQNKHIFSWETRQETWFSAGHF